MVEALNALQLLQEEMKTEEINLKVNAVHRLKTVITQIGTQQTIDNLIPYLTRKSYCPKAPAHLACTSGLHILLNLNFNGLTD